MYDITYIYERDHLMATLNKIGTEHVYMTLHASDVRMEKVADHPKSVTQPTGSFTYDIMWKYLRNGQTTRG